MISIAWTITALALIALAAATWRRTTRSILRIVPAIVAAAGLSYALTGNIVSLALIVLDVALVLGTWRVVRSGGPRWIIGWIAALVVILVVAKWPALSFGPAVWIGVSYLIFRLIHVCLDARNNRLGDITLPEMIVYALHPATLIAGPIDRVQRSAAEQRCQPTVPRQYINDGLWRLLIGLFKKAALANLCYAFIAAHDMARQPDQPQGIAWLWLVVYSFYLYFDFAAYSDMAIGVARLMGMRLPENFANPYMQPTIARFWQAWHITLSTWLRDYIFFPLSRNLMKRYGSRFAMPILLISHLTTMIACGLWHGLGSGFAAWGAWHGLGLFGYSQVPALRQRFNLPVLHPALGAVVTYGFVALGWVFFAADLPTALRILGRLFGVQ
ncbi:MAG: hypothetical protein IT324_27495 [Anaerolineae bacterium]|nr:hypothetical protein [Anaerolineae bacterium]